jgi:glycerol-3-phosphate acyltransferase PlsX
MTDRPIIALDAMGGDGGPAVTIAAAEIAHKRYPGLRFRFYGREDAIRAELARAPRVAADCVVVHTDEEVLATDKPSQVLRRARRSSMGLAVDAVKNGEAQAAVSAGNTGALMAMMKSESVMLDLGANTECDETNLVQFAVMGAAFARTVLGLKRPRVALLNIGEEDLKGTHELKAAAAMLRDADLPMEFTGFTEGDKIGRGDIDVVVTDGFSGNIALKTAEGTAKLVVSLLANAFRSSALTKLGYLMSRPALRALRGHLDPNNHNGAVFLGLNGIVVKSHGGATPLGVANAIAVAYDLVADDIARRIADDLANFATRRDPAVDVRQSDASAA